MKILVTGSRSWANQEAIRRELSKLPGGTIIVHGHCRAGADRWADKIARELGFEVRRYPADWDTYSIAAGPIRNSEMLKKEHPDANGVPIDFVLAFHPELRASKGTKDMVIKSRKVGLEVRLFEC